MLLSPTCTFSYLYLRYYTLYYVNCPINPQTSLSPPPLPLPTIHTQGLPTKRATDIFDRCFEKGVFLRAAGGSVVMSPPLICEKEHIDRIINTLADAIVESSKLLK